MVKSSLQILVGLSIVIQTAGCFFVDRDHRDRGHYEHRVHQDHIEPAIDVHLHN